MVELGRAVPLALSGAAAALACSRGALAQSPDSPTFSTSGLSFLHSSMQITRARAGIDVMPGIVPLFGGTRAPQSLELWAPQPYPVAGAEPMSLIGFDPFQVPLTPGRNVERWAQSQLALRMDLYDVVVYQAATYAQPGYGYTSGINRLNVRGDVKLWDFGGGAVGRFTAQYRYSIQFPNDVSEGTKAGTDVSLDSDWTGFENRIARFKYEQGILDNNVTFVVGKINPNDYLLNIEFASDETSQFLASIFDGTDVPASGFEGFMLGTGLLVTPMPGMYLNAVATNPATSQSADLGLNYLDSGLWWFGTEFGVITDFGDKSLPGNYAIGFNATNASYASTSSADAVDGSGFWLYGSQYLTTDLGVFAQIGYTDPSVAAYSQEATAGVSIENCFDRRNDGFGAAIGFSVAPQADLGTQMTIETYYRLQLTASMQLTADIQVIDHPVQPLQGTSSDQTMVVFGIRALVRF